MLHNYLERSVQRMITLFGGEFSEMWFDYKLKKAQINSDIATAVIKLFIFAIVHTPSSSVYNQYLISAFVYSLFLENEEVLIRYKLRRSFLEKADELLAEPFIQRRQHPYLLDLLNDFKEAFA